MNFSIIARQGKAVVVEWHDALGPHRSVIPAEQAAGTDDLPYSALIAGIPYGVAWETLDAYEDMPGRIARELRERGIWTEQDMRRNLDAVRGALQAAYGISLATLIDGARRARGG